MNTTEETVAELERAFPNYQVWIVPTFDGRMRRTIWCAKRWDWQPGDPVINEDSAQHLRESLEEAAER